MVSRRESQAEWIATEIRAAFDWSLTDANSLAEYLAARLELRQAEQDARVSALVAAAQSTLTFLKELRDAWQRGALSENDGQGGARSNRNVDLGRALQAALVPFEENADGS